jgi:hypothetical protein
LLPATLNTAAAIPLVTVKVALPRDVLPRAKLTVPAGRAVPLAAFTIAVTVVVALGAMVAGLAAATVVVAVTDAVTTTTTDPADAAKPLLAT